MIFKTLHFRIKDKNCRKHLSKMGYAVNFVWNYCNETNHESWKKFRRLPSKYDFHALTSGCSKDLGLNSQTIRAVCEEYFDSSKRTKRSKIAWRSKKHSLGWIPFKGVSVQVNGNTVTYAGRKMKFWRSCTIDSKIRHGSFSENSCGEWFLNLVVECSEKPKEKSGISVGIDLGIKSLVVLSDGNSFSRENITRCHEKELATAQRANKKKRVSAIHNKIKNKRRDWSQKTSTLIINQYDQIFVGDVSSSKLKKTKMAKSVSDAGWSDFKQMLAYKSIRVGIEYKEVKESYSTVTCSTCFERSGPRGLGALGVREWTCSHCGSQHDRDVNAAKNILRIGHDTPIKGVQA